ERARDYLHKTGRFIVIGGIVSPVHDSYGKTVGRPPFSLSASYMRWVDPWECYQDTWQTTCSVLEHHRDLMKRVTGCILSNVNTPSITPTIYQNNNNVSNKPTAAKILGKVGESLSRICCVRPPMERFTFVDENANLGTVMRYEEIELRILLLCGSDLLESFCIPGLWNEADVSHCLG
ncbi:Nicotinamide mononucleotide adenylyltransferase 2, partial [Tyto alba]